MLHNFVCSNDCAIVLSSGRAHIVDFEEVWLDCLDFNCLEIVSLKIRKIILLFYSEPNLFGR